MLCCFCCFFFFNDFVLAVVRGEREGNVDKLEEGWNICESIRTGWVLRNWVCIWTCVLYTRTGSMWPKGCGYIWCRFLNSSQLMSGRRKNTCKAASGKYAFFHPLQKWTFSYLQIGCVGGELNSSWNGHTWAEQLFCWMCCFLMLPIPQQAMYCG